MWRERKFEDLTLGDRFVTKDLFVAIGSDASTCMMTKLNEDSAYSKFQLNWDGPYGHGSSYTTYDLLYGIEVSMGRMILKIEPDRAIMQVVDDNDDRLKKIQLGEVEVYEYSMETSDDVKIMTENLRDQRRQDLLDKIIKETIQAKKGLEKLNDTTGDFVKAMRASGNSCPDCKGSGQYEGLRDVEDCRRCGGTGLV